MNKSLISDKENATIYNDTTVPFLNPAFQEDIIELIRAHMQIVISQIVVGEDV